MLSDPQKRAAYDQHGFAVLTNMRGGAEAYGGFAEAFGDIFGDMFGQSRGRAGGKQVYRGSDLSYAMEVTLEEAAKGKDAQIRIPSWDACDTCHGSGAKPGTQVKSCGTCGGSGSVQMRQGFFSVQQTCPTCAGLARSSRALQCLPRPGQDQAAENSRGQDSIRYRRWHAHPKRGQW